MHGALKSIPTSTAVRIGLKTYYIINVVTINHIPCFAVITVAGVLIEDGVMMGSHWWLDS